uniref:7-cyano-7-deazaguanine synthase n=1 Tax=viral metagenome TaxID=1070528 RepID=A0A6M3LJ47_9ZZZZ
MNKKFKDEKALVLFSGGQDSTTCLIWAKKQFKKVIALSFDYQQKQSIELQQGKIICKKLNVERIIVNTSFINKITENALTRKAIKIEHKKGELPSTFVAGRNLFFLSIAAAIAYQKNIKNIVTGVCQTDYSGYPDCRDKFVKSLNQTLNLAMDSNFIIHTPLMWLTKAESIKLIDDLGGIDLLKDTHTCYDPVSIGVNIIPCSYIGTKKFEETRNKGCPACKLRNNAFLELKITDPLYEQKKKIM